MSFLVWISECSNCQDRSGWLLWLLSMLPIFFGKVRKPIPGLHHCAVMVYHHFEAHKPTELGKSLSGIWHVPIGWLKRCKNSPAMALSLEQSMDVYTKVIDNLHIWNHKEPLCQEAFSPATLKKELPEGNTVAIEQTLCSSLGLRNFMCHAKSPPSILLTLYGKTS